MLKKVVLVILGLLLLVVWWQRELLLYGFQQAKGQVNVLWNAKPVAEIINDPSFPDSLKQKLFLIESVRKFAIDSLGLNESSSYQSLYNQQGKPILWVVTACPKYELKEYQWNFPFLGSLGYKGYFDKQKAETERIRLENLGYDVDISEVNAWSTLGFFNDPILSNMLYKSDGDLASLIIHELTHATLYIPDDATFNENLATFIGNYGALTYFNSVDNNSSKRAVEYIGLMEDRKLIANHMLNGARKLDSLYRSESFKNAGNVDKEGRKRTLIEEIIIASDTLSLNSTKRLNFLKKNKLNIHNTYFMSYKMYNDNQQDFVNAFYNQFGGDYSKMISFYKSKYGG